MSSIPRLPRVHPLALYNETLLREDSVAILPTVGYLMSELRRPSTRLIPSPGYTLIRRDSLLRSMGLKEKDRPRYRKALVSAISSNIGRYRRTQLTLRQAQLRRLCPDYLDVDRVHREQSKENWRKFCRAVRALTSPGSISLTGMST